MKLTIKDPRTGGNLLLWKGEEDFDRLFYGRDQHNKYFTIAWNAGDKQTVTIDGSPYEFPSQAVLPLMFNQSFHFEASSNIVAWQFNREFYCVIDHDTEVGCVGFLFGLGDNIFIRLDEPDQHRLQLLLNVFEQELNTNDQIQNEMLLVLLKRLIIMVTRLARASELSESNWTEERYHVMRKFNLLVEMHFREEHSVRYYAELLNKSPKTLSNIFGRYHNKTPQQVIQDQIIIEARRLLRYTDKSAKQITYELGFEDTAYFSNFFKRNTGSSPLEFRNSRLPVGEGK